MSAGIPASELSDDDLERELAQLHETRSAILFSGTADQLANHVARTHELEHAALERFTERIRDAAAKVEALHAHEGQRTIKGSVTEPLARGGHTEHGWRAEAPDLDQDDHRGNVSGVDNETGTEAAAGASGSDQARAGDVAEDVADTKDDAEAIEQSRRA